MDRGRSGCGRHASVADRTDIPNFESRSPRARIRSWVVELGTVSARRYARARLFAGCTNSPLSMTFVHGVPMELSIFSAIPATACVRWLAWMPQWRRWQAVANMDSLWVEVAQQLNADYDRVGLAGRATRLAPREVPRLGRRLQRRRDPHPGLALLVFRHHRHVVSAILGVRAGQGRAGPLGSPRAWAQRTHNVVRYTRMPHGGHFAPIKRPTCSRLT